MVKYLVAGGGHVGVGSAGFVSIRLQHISEAQQYLISDFVSLATFAHARCSWCLVTLMRTAPTGTSPTSMYVPSVSVVTHRLLELHPCEHMQAACSLHVLLQSSCASAKNRWHLEDPSFGVAL